MMSNLKCLELAAIVATILYTTVVTWTAKAWYDWFYEVSTLWALLCSVYLECKRSTHETKKGQMHLYRLDDSHGVWCCVLVPLAIRSAAHVFGQGLNHDDVIADIGVKFLHLTMPISLCVHMFMLSGSGNTWLYTLEVILYIWPALWLAAQTSVQFLVILYIWCFLFLQLLVVIPKYFPQCFTFGEAAVVTQIGFLLLYRAGNTLASALVNPQPEVETVCCVSIVGLILAVAVVCLTNADGAHPLRFYPSFLTVGLLMMLPLMYILLGRNPLLWLLEYVFTSKTRAVLMGYWFLCAAVSGVLVCFQGNQTDKRSTSTTSVIRKFFHLMVIVVYVPGLMWDPELLYMVTIGALALLVIIEIMRYSSVPPLGPALKSYFSVFMDKQDKGDLILTPVYLLIGCSFPLWVSSKLPVTGNLSLYAGVVSLGAGDTAASVGGRLMGRNKWPDSDKSVEGTVMSILAQILMIVFLSCLGVPDAVLSSHVLLTVVLVSCLEAFTQHIDNLVLPLVAYKLLAVT